MACKNALSSSNSIEQQSSDETDEEDRLKNAVTGIAKIDANKLAQASTPNPNSRGTEMKTRYYKVTTFKHLNLSEIRKREIIHRMRREESIEEDEKENESSSDDSAMQVDNSPPIFNSSARAKTNTNKQNPQNCAVLPPAQFPTLSSTRNRTGNNPAYNRRRATFSLEPVSSNVSRNPHYTVPKRYSVSLGGNPVLELGGGCSANANAQKNTDNWATITNTNGRVSVNVTLHSPSSSTAPSFPGANDNVPTRPLRTHPTRPNFLPIPGHSSLNPHKQSNKAHGSNTKSLTYSTSCKSPDGYRSQLQIQIGPNGGTTISASRRRTSSDEQMTKDLIAAQLERKEKLMRAFLGEQSRVDKLRAEIGLLRSKLHSYPNLERLKDENQRLRIECDLMAREVDLYDNGTVPLGELNPEFYRDINPGQDANALFSNSLPRKPAVSGRRPTGSRMNAGAPPRPPPPRYLPIPKIDSPTGEWCCTVCTFQNHPQLTQCEQCDMIRVIPSPSISPGFPRL